ncbi:hypothetical protein [Vibrio sp. Isolate24]|uniref:hypothetical protein n=1 Tax=Vibrio sp. Isolate24 TaxID=2908534 RepID=UPI001EFCE6FE|nr:hypothetical protein [Vibrio sp. Isolate24]MCG9676929.1 hypothetical protein [Vibrio sp. Isolate24]
MNHKIWMLITSIVFSTHSMAEEVSNVACSDIDAIEASLNDTTDVTSTLISLLSSCPEQSTDILAMASQTHTSESLAVLDAAIQTLAPEQIAKATAIIVSHAAPDAYEQLIQQAVLAAPDYAQDIVDAVAELNLLDPTDILVAAISGGADPALISEPTAAGIATAPPLAVNPGATTALGTGNGSGGGTASPN